MKRIKQSFLLLLSFGLVFLWNISPLDQYTIPMLGFLVFIFLLTSAKKKEFNPASTLTHNELTGVFILNSVILLLIFSTGEFSSPLFFLLYFLEFGIAFVFDPVIVFIFIIGATALFLPDALKDDSIGNLIRLGSLIFIAPLAYYFGREFTNKNINELPSKKEKSSRKA